MIEIVNWSSFQSYKDRKPPWIRLHKSMLDNYEFHSMSENAKSLIFMLWLLASEDEDPVSGLIRYGYGKIAFRLRMTEQKVKDGCEELERSGFIQLNQSCNDSVTNELRIRNQTVTSETETEGDIEKFGEFKNVKLSSDEYQKLKERFNGSCDDYIERLSAYLAQSGKRYKNHYATILNWSRKDQKESSSKSVEQDRLDKPWMYGG